MFKQLDQPRLENWKAQERTADDGHVCLYDTAHHRNYAVPKSCYFRSVKTLDEISKADGGDSRGPGTSCELRLPDLKTFR